MTRLRDRTMSAAQRDGRTMFTLLTTAIAMVLALGVGRSAHAQALPFVPEPVSTPELMGYADLLDLSDEQRLAILPIHDRYKAQYEEFNEREVQELLDRIITIGSQFRFGSFNIPAKAELEGVLEQFDRVVTRAEQIDRQFFQQLGAVLTDDQRRTLERARELRELEIIHEIVSQLTSDINRGAGIDLGEMVRRLPMSEEERGRVEPALLSYERAYLREAKDAYKSLREAAQYAIESIDALGLRDLPQEELIQLFMDEEFQQRVAERFDEGSRPIQLDSHEMSQLNVETLRKIGPMLRPEFEDDLRHRFHRSGYRRYYDGLGEWRQRYRRALDLDALATSQREAVRAQLETSRRQDDGLIDDIVDLVEKRREYRTFRMLEEGDAAELEEQIEAIQDRRERVAEAANNALNGLLTPDLIAKIDDPDFEENREATASGVMGGAVAEASGGGQSAGGDSGRTPEEAEEEARRREREVRMRFGGMDDYLPMWMSRSELRRLSEALGWEEEAGKQALLRTVYTDYRDDYEAALDDAESKLEDDEDGDGDAGSNKPAIERRDDLLTNLAAIDARFFDDLALLAESDGEARVIRSARRLRERTLKGELAKSMSSSFGEEEAYVDLLAIILEQSDARGLVRALDEQLSSYDQQMATLASERIENARTVRKRWRTVERINAQGGGLTNRGMAEAAMDRWREAREDVAKINGRIRSLNRRMLDECMDRVSDDAAWELRFGYNQAAFPEIFEDGESAKDDFEQVRALPDLTPSQRESLNSIALDYRSRYFELSEKMVDLRMAQDLDIVPFQMPDKETIQQFIDLERLKQKRDEVNHRARLRLRLRLTDNQLDRLPELRRKTTRPV